MPDAALVPNRWERAVDEVAGYLSDQFPGTRSLSEAELQKYKLREVKRGWQLKVDFGGNPIALNILISPDFPWRPIRLALADLERTLVWPHVEDDGVLCIYSSIDEFSVENPIATLQRALADAVALIESSIAGTNRDDFKNELQPYWGRKAADSNKVYSLAAATPVTRPIKVWHGKDKIFVADTEEEIRSWLKNRHGADPCKSFENGLVIALPEPLLPEEYPDNSHELMKLAQRAGASAALANIVEGNPSSVVVLLHMQTDNGPAIAPVVVASPKSQRIADKVIVSDPLHKGFRPGHLPPELLVRRYLGGGKSSRRQIQRIDSSWVHNRDSDVHHSILRAKRVAIIGCGSLGSSIAAQLAATGIGEFLFVDGENFAWENIGRHYLGAGYVGKNKAQALAEALKKDYPHTKTIEIRRQNWEAINKDDPIIQTCDVIVSAVGSWGTEGRLNEWHLNNGRDKPIVYAWLEPHALAAHALAIQGIGGCFACHLTSYGTPTFKVTEWDDRQTRQEPSCGGFFQPYGPMGLADAAGLAGKLVLDVLMGRITRSTAHTWIGRTVTIQEMGGRISGHWQEKVTAQSRGEFISAWNYDAHEGCPWCSSI